MSPSKLKIWVDADACPQPIRAVIYKAAKRLEIETTLVANASIPIPKSHLIKMLTVAHGANVADNTIIREMSAGDIVVTGDIPLAARVVEKNGIAIGPRGEKFDDDTVHGRLASRNLMEQFRAAGMETTGPRPHTSKDTQAFANLFDRTLTQSVKSS